VKMIKILQPWTMLAVPYRVSLWWTSWGLEDSQIDCDNVVAVAVPASGHPLVEDEAERRVRMT
jgi:hypothetical protein